MSISAVVHAGQFTELNGVDRQADITVSGKPSAVVLIVGFVAVIDSVDLHPAVAANVKNGRRRAVHFFWHVKVAGDVEAGAGLIVKFVNLELVVLHHTGDFGLERSAFGEWIQPKHLMELPAVLGLFGVPIVEGFDLGKIGLGQAFGFALEILGENPVTGCF